MGSAVLVRVPTDSRPSRSEVIRRLIERGRAANSVRRSAKSTQHTNSGYQVIGIAAILLCPHTSGDGAAGRPGLTVCPSGRGDRFMSLAEACVAFGAMCAFAALILKVVEVSRSK